MSTGVWSGFPLSVIELSLILIYPKGQIKKPCYSIAYNHRENLIDTGVLSHTPCYLNYFWFPYIREGQIKNPCYLIACTNHAIFQYRSNLFPGKKMNCYCIFFLTLLVHLLRLILQGKKFNVKVIFLCIYFKSSKNPLFS